jgi:hypothetical protein
VTKLISKWLLSKEVRFLPEFNILQVETTCSPNPISKRGKIFATTYPALEPTGLYMENSPLGFMIGYLLYPKFT